jgi:4-amino-4-deoxy-L-arabinose transferase-like glycosyltransferase
MVSKSHIPFLIILTVLAYFSIVQGFDKQTLNMWDEATYANNAIDMLENPSIVVRQEGKVDLYNTKPPLVISLQALSMKVFGINTFAVRLPSIVFALSTVFFLYLFCFHWFKNHWIGFIGSCILICSPGFVRNHIALTGDLDSVLTFFLTTSFLLSLYLILKSKMDTKYLILLGLCFFLGFMTKGIAGFFHAPTLALLVLIFNRKLLKEKKVYFLIVPIFLFSILFYLLREWMEPGYLQIVFESEISRVNTVVMDWQVKPFSYYLSNLYKDYFFPFILLFPLGIIAIIINKEYRKILVSLATAILTYFLIISFPKVKLDWYDAPLYPLMSLFIGLSLVTIISGIIKNKLPQKIFYVVILVALCYPALQQIRETKQGYISNNESIEAEGEFLSNLSYLPQNTTIFKREQSPEHFDQVLFYIRALEKDQGGRISIKAKPHFSTKEHVIVSQDKLKQEIDSLYYFRIIDLNKKTNTELRLIIEKK